jgi:hypothetical protein
MPNVISEHPTTPSKTSRSPRNHNRTNSRIAFRRSRAPIIMLPLSRSMRASIGIPSNGPHHQPRSVDHINLLRLALVEPY